MIAEFSLDALWTLNDMKNLVLSNDIHEFEFRMHSFSLPLDFVQVSTYVYGTFEFLNSGRRGRRKVRLARIGEFVCLTIRLMGFNLQSFKISIRLHARWVR